MKAFKAKPILLLTAIALLAASMFLPLWSKNGISVTAWQGPYLTIGRWILLTCTIATIAFLAIKPLQKPWILATIAAATTIQSLLILWKGYKLHAIAPGAFLLFAAALLLATASFLYARASRQA